MIDEIYASQVRLEELVADDFRVSNQRSERWKCEIDKQTISREVGFKPPLTRPVAEAPVSKGWRWQESVSRARNGERPPLDSWLGRGLAEKFVRGVSVGNERGESKANFSLGQVVSLHGKFGSEGAAKVAPRADYPRVGCYSAGSPSVVKTSGGPGSTIPARIPASEAVTDDKSKNICRKTRASSPLEVCGDVSLNDVARVGGDMDMLSGKAGVFENCNTDNKSATCDVSMSRAETAIFGLVMHSVESRPTAPDASTANRGMAHGEAPDGQHTCDLSPVMQMPVIHLLSQRSSKVEGGHIPAGTDTANSHATNNSRATQSGGQTQRTKLEANLVVYGSNGRRYYCHLGGR